MALPTMSSHVARMRTMKRILSHLSHRMGNTSSESVLSNFIDILQSASPQLKLAIALLTPWALLTTAVLKYSCVTRWLDTIKTFVCDSLFASVSIPSSHPLNQQVLAYMVDHGLGKNARTLALSLPYGGQGSSSSREVVDRLMYNDRLDSFGHPRSKSTPKRFEDDDPDQRALSYVPEMGRYTFWFKWHRFTFERRHIMHEPLDSPGHRLYYHNSLAGGEEVVISCTSPFSGVAPIQEFLQHIQKAPAKDRTTTIYRPNPQNTAWDQGISRPSRTLNAVTLDAKVKDDLVKDVQTYLSPATRKYYANRGIPYRRGLLFYGNPGCGKTSLVNALAGHFGINIYMFSLSNDTLHDGSLEILFEQLPSRCIVLLEDIDSAGLKREKMREKGVRRPSRPVRVYDHHGRRIPDPEFDDDLGDRAGVTLSGLLNVLDGIHSKEGMLTIMTSNSPDTLDPALVRPGRIDRKILFGYCSKEVLASLFRHIFEKAPDELVEGETATTMTTSRHDVTALAEEFAAKVPADKLTPAEVQGYLLVHREDPVGAVRKVEEWAQATVDRKAKGAIVEAFSSEMKEKKDTKDKQKGDSDDSTSDSEDSDASCASTTSAASRRKRRSERRAREEKITRRERRSGRHRHEREKKEIHRGENECAVVGEPPDKLGFHSSRTVAFDAVVDSTNPTGPPTNKISPLDQRLTPIQRTHPTSNTSIAYNSFTSQPVELMTPNSFTSLPSDLMSAPTPTFNNHTAPSHVTITHSRQASMIPPGPPPPPPLMQQFSMPGQLFNTPESNRGISVHEPTPPLSRSSSGRGHQPVHSNMGGAFAKPMKDILAKRRHGDTRVRSSSV